MIRSLILKNTSGTHPRSLDFNFKRMSIYTDIASFAIPIIGGGFLLAFANKRQKQLTDLQNKGLRAEGVVFELEGDSAGSMFGGDRDGWELNTKNPVVRFVTVEKEWITAQSSHAVHSLYKAGQAVNVVYNKEDPADFFIESKLIKIIYPTLQAVGGLLLIAGGVMFVLKLL
ncbi:MAG: DUF3592 domain-containing protein [Chitinophagaceae bacterium]|nr:MAG: DUF3592 domain-containing protein [Chitinophagaceae bacterium]